MTDYMSAEEARALISAAAYRAATELGRAELHSQTLADYDGFMAAHEAAIRADEREKDYEWLLDAGFIGAATELRDARSGEKE